ncbi:MAG: SH3 domain-containing protein [Chloroflexota bacterium]
MSLSDIPRITLFVLAALALLFAFRSLMTGLRSRTAVKKQYFNVGRLEAQRNVFKQLLATVGFVILALALLVGALFVPDDLFDEPEVVAEETSESAPVEEAGGEQPIAETEQAAAPTDTVIEEGEIAPAQAETSSPDPTATPVPTETPIPTPEINYVFVNSPIVGLYIRDLPEGDIIDVLDDQTRLGVLGDSEIVNDINWILVVTDDGREGWVAEQFVTDIPPEPTIELPQESDTADSVEENG